MKYASKVLAVYIRVFYDPTSFAILGSVHKLVFPWKLDYWMLISINKLIEAHIFYPKL